MIGRDSSTTSANGLDAMPTDCDTGVPAKPLRWRRIVICQTLAAVALGGGALVAGSLSPSEWINMTQATSFALACSVVWVFCVASTVALTLAYARGVNAIMIAWFGGLAVRMIGSLAGGWMLVLTQMAEPRPMAIGLGITYLTLLLIEAGMLGRAMFDLTAPVKPSQGREPQPAAP